MIIQLEEAKYKLQNMRANIEELGSALRIDQLNLPGSHGTGVHRLGAKSPQRLHPPSQASSLCLCVCFPFFYLVRTYC